MRVSRIAILLATMTSVLHADGGPVADFPRVDETEWKAAAFRMEVADASGMDELHKAGYEALCDFSQPAETGVALYTRMAERLADSRDIENARIAYMSLVRELANLSIGRSEELVPDSMLDAAAAIARTDAEKSLVHFLSGWRCADSESPERRSHAGAEFSQATALDTPLLQEQMLLHHLRWALTDGASEIMGSGELKTCPDYEKALLLCQTIAAKARGQDTINYAVNCANDIIKPSLNLSVTNAFRTGSQAQFGVKWRNCESVEVALYNIKPDQIPISGTVKNPAEIAAALSLPEGAEPVRRITLGTPPTRKYYAVDETARMDDLLLPGTYLVKVTSGDSHAEDLLFITDSVLTVKIGKTRVLAFACNAQTGKPIPGATIAIWSQSTDGTWRRAQKNAGIDGIAQFAGAEIGSPADASEAGYVAILTKDQQQAMSFYTPTAVKSSNSAAWAEHTFADCDDYTPGSIIRVISLVRKNDNDSAKVPVGENVTIELSGPDSFPSVSATVPVDAYGMAIAEIPLPDKAPYGIYRITTRLASDGRTLGKSKAISVHGDYTPDYKISIRFDSADGPQLLSGGLLKGRAKVTTLTDDIVTGQPAEILIDERAYDVKKGRGYGEWKTVSHTTKHTNATGEAAFSCQTGGMDKNDVEMRVRVVVADSDETPSVATARILATRQSFYASLKTEGTLYEQGRGVKLNLTTRNASGDAVRCRGTLRLLRESWTEVWTDRRGHEISGDEMREIRKRSGGWFGLGQNAGDYILKSQGYLTETVLETPLITDDQGQAYFVWDDAKPGYYHFAWMGENEAAAIVSCEHSFWVSGKNAGIEGYRPDRIRLVSDASVSGSELTMITAPTTNQSVLVILGGDDIVSGSLVELKGTAQALETKLSSDIPTEYMEAICVNDEKVDSATTLLRHPTAQRLSVAIHNNKTDFEPGQNASFDITVTDRGGKPASDARVCFWITGAADESDRSNIELFPPIPSSYQPRTAASCLTRPFYQPQVQNGAASGKSTASEKKEENPQTDSLAGETSVDGTPTAPTAVWIADGITDAEGRVHFTTRMPRFLSLWTVEAVASSKDGAAGAANIHVTTTEAISVTLNVPDSLYAGDRVNIAAHVTNHESDNVRFGLSLKNTGTLSTEAAFAPAFGELLPDSSFSTAWPVTFASAGRAGFSASVTAGDKTLNYAVESLVRPNPYVETRSSSAWGMEPDLVIPPPRTNATRATAYECTLAVAPSRIALGTIPSLLTDKSQGSSEAVTRLAVLSSLKELLAKLRYSDAEIRDAFLAVGEADYAKNRKESDMEILQSTQNPDGSWGWLTPEKPDAFLTAYNLLLLNLCDDQIAGILASNLAKARSYAASQLVTETQGADLRAVLLYGLASREPGRTKPSRLEARALVSLMRVEDTLSPFALACLALSAKQYGFDDEASEIVKTLRAKAVPVDDITGRTLHWNQTDIGGSLPISDVENTAMSVIALLANGRAQDTDVEEAVRYLYSRSENGHWDGAHETALCVLVLRDLATISAETDIEAKCAVVVDGVNAGNYDSSADKRPGPPLRMNLTPGANGSISSVQISRISGGCPVFATLTASYDSGLSQAQAVPGLTLTRRYLRSLQVPTLLNGINERVAELDAAAPLNIGDRLEVLVTLTTDRDRPSLVMEEPKPAFAVRHVATTPNITCTSDPTLKPGKVTVSFMDGSLVLNIEDLPAGTWEISNPLRVDYSGEYALPSIRAWVPERPSIAAESGLLRVKCQPAPNPDAAQ